MSITGVVEEVVDSDDGNDDYGIDDDDRFDNQNTTDDSDVITHSNTDPADMKDDAVGCFTSHTGLLEGYAF